MPLRAVEHTPSTTSLSEQGQRGLTRQAREDLLVDLLVVREAALLRAPVARVEERRAEVAELEADRAQAEGRDLLVQRLGQGCHAPGVSGTLGLAKNMGDAPRTACSVEL